MQYDGATDLAQRQFERYIDRARPVAARRRPGLPVHLRASLGTLDGAEDHCRGRPGRAARARRAVGRRDGAHPARRVHRAARRPRRLGRRADRGGGDRPRDRRLGRPELRRGAARGHPRPGRRPRPRPAPRWARCERAAQARGGQVGHRPLGGVHARRAGLAGRATTPRPPGAARRCSPRSRTTQAPLVAVAARPGQGPAGHGRAAGRATARPLRASCSPRRSTPRPPGRSTRRSPRSSTPAPPTSLHRARRRSRGPAPPRCSARRTRSAAPSTSPARTRRGRARRCARSSARGVRAAYDSARGLGYARRRARPRGPGGGHVAHAIPGGTLSPRPGQGPAAGRIGPRSQRQVRRR